MVIMLVAVLSVTALAGDMPGGGKSAPGDMPGVGGSIAGDMPTVGLAGETSAPPVPGEMPGGGSAISSTTDPSLVTTVLLTIITLIGR